MSKEADFTVEPLAGTRADTYRYRGPEGEIDFDLDVDLYALEPVLRDGRCIRVIDEMSLGWSFESPQVPAEIRSRVIERLAGFFEGQGVPCDVRLESGALRDRSGNVRPGFRHIDSATRYSDGWGVIDFYRSGSYHGASIYPDLSRLGRWLAPIPYPDSIEYREDGERARIARRVERRLASELPEQPAPSADDRLCVSVLYPDTMCWIRPSGREPVEDAARIRILARIAELAKATGRLYDTAAGEPPPDPDAASATDEEYDSYPYAP
jgi:hypothetical protein